MADKIETCENGRFLVSGFRREARTLPGGTFLPASEYRYSTQDDAERVALQYAEKNPDYQYFVSEIRSVAEVTTRTILLHAGYGLVVSK